MSHSEGTKVKGKTSIKTLISTLLRLGLANAMTVFFYRLAIRSRLVEKLMPARRGYRDLLFSVIHIPDETLQKPGSSIDTVEEAVKLRNGNLRFFSNRLLNVGSPPDWSLNPFNSKRFLHPELHWSRLSDFDSGVGDIKSIWELSRFDWVLTLARAYRLTGDEAYLTILNEWTSDWTEKNPLYVGPNWKCGQETAIRMMQVLLATYLLRQHRTPTAGLRRFVTEHCSRITPTIRYAIAQNNNHGTSEAVGLYIGGAWLAACPQNDKKRRTKLALRWQQLGRHWLEDRVSRLVAPDGSFSQYSLNYHRVLLDTLNMVEFWRRELQLPDFSKLFYERAAAAVEWLYQMVDPQTGDGPNLGSNDGARLFALSATDYRDYRPSVQLGAVLFLGGRVYPEGPWDEALTWLGLNQENSPPSPLTKVGFSLLLPERERQFPSWEGQGVGKKDSGKHEAPKPTPNPSQEGNLAASPAKLRLTRKSCVMPDGGYVIMHFPLSDGKVSWGLIRFPNFRFRPSHADALHFDLWYNGINLLRDSGSYSYNVDEPWQSYFFSTGAHNTIQFDGRDQMPRLSRFLFGEWLRMEHIGELIIDDSPFEEPVLSPVLSLSKGLSKGGREILSPLEGGRGMNDSPFEGGRGMFLSWTGSYIDYKRCKHKRTVSSNGLVWKIVDEIEGFDIKGVLRWRLAPGHWQVDGLTCIGELAELSIACTTSITSFELVEGWESRYYMEKTELPVLEVQVEPGKATLTTEIRLRT